MVFPGVGGNRVKVTIEGDTKPLKRDLAQADRDVKGFSDSVGGEVGGLASKIGVSGAAIGAALAVGVGAAVVDAIGSANDLNESINAVGVIFGGASDKVLEFGETSATSIGQAQSAFNESVIPIGALLSNFGLAADDVADKTLALTQRAADLGSTLNIDTAIGLDKMRAGLAGESEPLRAFGVDVSVAALTVEALNMGLISQGEKLDKTAKAQAAFSIIMRETEFAAGDFANTLDESLSNQMKVFTAQVEDAKAAIGQELLPVAMELLGVLIELVPVFTAVAAGAAGLAGAVLPAAEALGTLADSETSAKDKGIGLLRVMGNFVLLGNPVAGSIVLGAKALGLFGDAAEETTFGLTEAQRAMRLLDAEAKELADGGLSNLTDGESGLEDATSRAIRKLEEQTRVLRVGVDPMFDAWRATRKLTEAQDEVNEAAAEYGEGSDEYVAALIAQVEASGDLQAALAALKEAGIDPTSAAAAEFFSEMGLTDDQIETIVGSMSGMLDRVGIEFATRNFDIQIGAPILTYQQTGGNTISPVQTGISQFAHGGIIQDSPGGRLGLFGEAGSDEAVIPLNDQGATFMAAVMAQAISKLGDSNGGGGGGVTINFPNYVGSKAELARMIRDELAKTSRRVGGADLFAI